jgi:hypothetical protein
MPFFIQSIDPLLPKAYADAIALDALAPGEVEILLQKVITAGDSHRARQASPVRDGRIHGQILDRDKGAAQAWAEPM